MGRQEFWGLMAIIVVLILVLPTVAWHLGYNSGRLEEINAQTREQTEKTWRQLYESEKTRREKVQDSFAKSLHDR